MHVKETEDRGDFVKECMLEMLFDLKKNLILFLTTGVLAHKSVFLNVSSDFILFFYFDNQFVPPNDVPCIIFYFCSFKNKNVLEENPVKSIQFQFY